MNKISVIIPSYNSAPDIERCVKSVVARYLSLEIIVVDDGSNDNSVRIIEGLCKKYPGMVRLVRQPANGGPAKARNAGAGNAGGEYLFFLDSDTEMLPDALDIFMKGMANCEAASGICHYEPLNKGIVPEYKAMLNYYFFSRKGVIRYEVFDSSRAGIKSDIFRKLGGFDENLKWEMARDYLIRTVYKDEFITPCVAGRKLLVITETGDVYPCEILNKKMGNLRDYDFDVKALLKHADNVEMLRWIRNSRCKCSFECALAANVLWGRGSFFRLLAASLRNIGKRRIGDS